MQNFDSVALIVSDIRCLDMTDKRMDGHGLIDFCRHADQKYMFTLEVLTCLLRPVTYILLKLMRPFFSRLFLILIFT